MAVTQVQDAQLGTGGSEAKRKPGTFAGLIERIRDGRERSRAVSLLSSSLSREDAGGPEFKEALEAFGRLSSQSKDRALSEAAALYRDYSSFPFESEHKTASLTTLSVFVAEAAAQLTAGRPDGSAVSARSGLLRSLVGISRDDSFYKADNAAHAKAKLAAAVALWELGYMECGFWEDRLRVDATRDFTITKMLEMPETTDFKEHGWHLLRKNLDTPLAISIASCASPARIDFLTSMMLDSDTKVVVSAMEGAAYLYPIPPEFLDMAAEAAGRSGELNCKARFFIAAAQARPLLEAAGDTQFMAALTLTELYLRGMRHLGPLLQDVVFPEMRDQHDDPAGGTDAARDENRNKAAGVIFQLHMAGIRTEGFIFNITEG